MWNATKYAGVALILGAILNIFRVLPILLSDGVSTENFPPHGLEDFAFFTQLNGWHISHLMGLISVPLILFSGTVLADEFKRQGQPGIAYGTLVGLSVSLILYIFALLVDGLILPQLLRELSPTIEHDRALAGIVTSLTHSFAANFAGFGSALLLLSSAGIGIGIIRSFRRPVLGGFGVLLGGMSLVGYMTGLLSVNITDGIERTGPLMVIFFAYLIFVGILLFRLVPITTSDDRL